MRFQHLFLAAAARSLNRRTAPKVIAKGLALPERRVRVRASGVDAAVGSLA